MIKSFLDGIFAYGKAISLLSKNGLWKFAFIPGLISLLLGIGIAATAWAVSDNIGYWLVSWYPFEWGKSVLSNISLWVGGAMVLVIGLIIYKHIVIVLVSPFMSPLSQKVEEQLYDHQTVNSGFQMGRAIKELWRGLRLAFRNIIRELFFVIPLFLLSFIPVFGIATGLLIFLVQAYYAGFGNMDYTLERHYNVQESIQFARQQRGLAIGIGSIFLLLLATGVGFLIAPPLATVAATLETTKRLSIEPQITLDELV